MDETIFNSKLNELVFHPILEDQIKRICTQFSEKKTEFNMFPETAAEWCSNKREIFSFTVDDTKYDGFEFPSIRDLFRECEMPEKTEDSLFWFDFSATSSRILLNAISLDLIPMPTDDEMADIFSALRRRPDGKPISLAHILVWKAAVCHLLVYRCSKELFEAVCHDFEKFAKQFNEGNGSCNFILYAEEVLDEIDSEEECLCPECQEKRRKELAALAEKNESGMASSAGSDEK